MTEHLSSTPEWEDAIDVPDVDEAFQEILVFNSLVDEMNDIPDHLKYEESLVAGGKFGQNKDFSGGFGQER